MKPTDLYTLPEAVALSGMNRTTFDDVRRRKGIGRTSAGGAPLFTAQDVARIVAAKRNRAGRPKSVKPNARTPRQP